MRVTATYYICTDCGYKWKEIEHRKEMWIERVPVDSIPEGKKVHKASCGDCSRKAWEKSSSRSQRDAISQLNRALVGSTKPSYRECKEKKKEEKLPFPE